MTEPAPGLEDLLGYIRATRAFDFTSYKRPSLSRRIRRRLEALGLDGFEAYQDHLEVHPEEFAALFDTVMINVTRFFREPESWDHLAREIVPRMLAEKDGEPVRIWSAGCASGQEAYSLAMLMCEAMGDAAYRQRVKIYATDVDEGALAEARSGSYSHKQVEGIPAELLERYFEDQGSRFLFRPELRRTIIFGRHDVTEDAPISRLDLLTCRNTLMYFTAETQRRVAARFHYALRGPQGYLFLGSVETLTTQADLFAQVAPGHRIYARRPRPWHGEPPILPARLGEADDGSVELIRQRALDESPLPQLAVDLDGRMVFANARARRTFGLRDQDQGRLFRDLELSFRPVELRSRIEEALESREPVVVREARRALPSGEDEIYDVTVQPLLDGPGAAHGTLVLFVEVSERVALRDQAQRSDQALEAANEELQSTNEELETSNEELQSTNEELETTNEELQSTNEELETLNEELRSTNEELGSMNEELQRRTLELGRLNTFMESIMASVGTGVIVVNSDVEVEAWNAHAQEMWGLRADEVTGRSLLGLDIGLPVSELGADIHRILRDASDGGERVFEAVNRRGRAIRCRVALTPLVRNDHGHDGVVLLMDQVDG